MNNKNKSVITYEASQFLETLVLIPKISMSDYKKIEKVLESCKKVSEEFQDKIKIELTKRGVESIGVEDEMFEEVNEILTNEFKTPSSVSIDNFKIFDKDEFNSFISDTKFSYGELKLMKQTLIF